MHKCACSEHLKHIVFVLQQAHETEIVDAHFLEGDPVRLIGLKSVQLNDKPGTIVSYDDDRKRFGVLIVGESNANAINTSNLIKYEPWQHDNCPRCQLCSRLKSSSQAAGGQESHRLA